MLVLGCSVVSDSLRHHGLEPARLLYPWNFPGKNTGVGRHFLLLGESSPARDQTCVSYISCIGRQVLLPLSPPGKPSLNKCCYNLAAKSLQSFPTLYDPHRRQPTKFCHPCDSSGKNTGVGCHFLLQCMKVKSESEVAQSCPTLSDPMDCSLPGSFVHGVFQATVLEWGAIIAIQIQNRICCFEIL